MFITFLFLAPKNLSEDVINKNSKIYGFNKESAKLSDWQNAVNAVALELAKNDPNLLYNRAELKLKAEEEARKTFVFKKRSGSRSVRVNNNTEPAVKRAKLSADDRKEKISAVSIQTDLVSKQITAKQNLCSRATSVKYYTLCSKLQGEMRALFKEKGSLESQLKELQKKESKSKWYKKKNSKPESPLPPPSSSTVRDIRMMFKVSR